ncbi:MAG: glycosyltransferase family 4 protein [Nitrospira sp.]
MYTVDFNSALNTQKTIRFGQLGRLGSMKGSIFAIGAFAQVINQGFDATYEFFGTGPMQDSTKELAKSLGVYDRVKFGNGYNWSDLDRIIAEIDVGVMPSIYEGFGLVMLELMSRSRPVIATDVGSSREVLSSLGGGWVVERADTTSLADAMINACRQQDSLTSMGKAARDIWVEHFTSEKMIERYLSFWKRNGAAI